MSHKRTVPVPEWAYKELERLESVNPGEFKKIRESLKQTDPDIQERMIGVYL